MYSEQVIKEYVRNKWPNLAVEIKEQVTSTNDEARNYALVHPGKAKLILAKLQTAGRGRYGKSFFSHLDAGLYMSLYLPVSNVPLEIIPLFTLASAAAMAESIEQETNKKIGIKWVNDLFFQKRKISGILCETVVNSQSGQIQGVIIGIGVNLAGEFTQAENNVITVAGTLFKDKLPAEISVNRIIGQFLLNIYDYGRNIEAREYLRSYQDRLLGINQEITYSENGVTHSAVIQGLTSEGHLLVKDKLEGTKALYGQTIHLSSSQFV